MRRVQSGVSAFVLCLLSFGLLGLDRASAEKVHRALKKGDPAPYFGATLDAGTKWVSSAYVSKAILVVYFYEADMTRASINQATHYRDDMKELVARGVKVVGVSGDSVKNHRVFKKALDLFL